MDTITLLQHYWWFIISLFGALLVFLMFVQGGQALLYALGRNERERNLLTGVLGHKWELTFTTLVTFGGAFFASFPLFYSTSFGGAFYVWMAILFCFVLQAVAYEYRRKPANVFGERTFNAFLLINGVLGPLLIGTAVGTFFTGAEFTVDRLNLANQGGAAVISQWATPWHGLEAIAEWRNVLLGAAVALLAMALACQYFMNNIDDETILRRAQSRMRLFGVLFVVCFVAWLLA
ncbi:cytochrome d ubiquinol oxidase subunit II, partial [Alistipes putredinis]|uniref:cytochrome d ubiquinol oxidase subunit II n=1 Tax=Alistipes putredinis TaxID=28117 RepID=UPI003FD81D25